MSQAPRAELTGILFQEIQTYLPRIETGLTHLQQSTADNETLSEVYRMFHNIKGAASQVSFSHLSNSAAICEAVVADLLEKESLPTTPLLDFLDTVNVKIKEFCALEEKSSDAEQSLLSHTISFFESLLAKTGSHHPIILPRHILALVEQNGIRSADSQVHLSDSSSEHVYQTRKDCLRSLRSIVPLLQELTSCTSTVSTPQLQNDVLSHIRKAISTLADCSATANLSAQTRLLESFNTILDKLHDNPYLVDHNTPDLLQEFLAYLDLIFSMEPDEGEQVISKIQLPITRLCTFLMTPGHGNQINDPSAIDGSADKEPSITVYDNVFDEQFFAEMDTTAFDNEEAPTLCIDFLEEELADENFAEETMELRGIFQSECEEHLEHIRQALATLATGVIDTTDIGSAERDPLATMRHSVHTLKGSAAITGFEDLAGFAYSFEKLLNWLHDSAMTISTSDIQHLQEAVQILHQLSLPTGGADSCLSAEFSSQLDEHLQARACEDLGINRECPASSASDTDSATSPTTDDLISPAESDTDRAELYSVFKAECDEHLQSIGESLQLLEEKIVVPMDITDDERDLLSRLRRSIHTLKGAAAMTGFSTTADRAHSLEDLLDWLHDDSDSIEPTDISVIAQAIDAIEQYQLPSTDKISETEDFSSQQVREHLEERKASSPSGRDHGTLSDPLTCQAVAGIGITQESEPAPSARIPDTSPPTLPDSVEINQEHSELVEVFRAECDEYLQLITQELHQLSLLTDDIIPYNDDIAERVANIRRSVHTLKGAAAMTGFQEIASCAHSVEDLLDWLHNEAKDITADDLTVISDAFDVIENLARADAKDSPIPIVSITETVRGHLTHRAASFSPETTLLPEDERTDLATTQGYQLEAKYDQQLYQKPPELHEETTGIPGDSGNVRVRLNDLDELVNIEGELVVARGAIEKLLDKYSQSLEELDTIKDTLRRKSQELETGFEAQSLYGFGSGSITEAGDSSQGSISVHSEFDPIELDRYSQLNLIIRSLNELSIDVNAIYSEMRSIGTSLQGQIAKQQLSMGLMQEKLMRIRMTPLSSISRMLFRTVRQTSAKLGKNIRLEITGKDVFMDRYVWTRTIDPLMHILRNCVDHGIESTDVRQQAGKPESGIITLDAQQRGRFVVLNISDDGQGINTDKLRHKLIEEGTISSANAPGEDELLNYIFKPSVSTRDDISQISGRGVGLDVVYRNIQELRGTVQVHNRPGQGVTFELRIPVTLSVNRAIIVEVGGNSYAVPIQDITEVRKFPHDQVRYHEHPHVIWGGTEISLIELAPRLQLKHSRDKSSEPDLLTLIVQTGDEHVAVQIDRVEEQREVVIKDLGSHLRYVRGINGVTLTGEGSIIPILNLLELTAPQAAVTTVIDTPASGQTAAPEADPLKVLVVDDSISVRFSISRLVEGQSWIAHQAVDGLDALEQLEQLIPDVIVLDIEMPRMNGYEFMGMLRGNDTLHRIPVIMLTSRASEKHRKKAEDLGVNHYLTKPFQEDDFIELLATYDNR